MSQCKHPLQIKYNSQNKEKKGTKCDRLQQEEDHFNTKQSP